MNLRYSKKLRLDEDCWVSGSRKWVCDYGLREYFEIPEGVTKIWMVIDTQPRDTAPKSDMYLMRVDSVKFESTSRACVVVGKDKLYREVLMSTLWNLVASNTRDAYFPIQGWVWIGVVYE